MNKMKQIVSCWIFAVTSFVIISGNSFWLFLKLYNIGWLGELVHPRTLRCCEIDISYNGCSFNGRFVFVIYLFIYVERGLFMEIGYVFFSIVVDVSRWAHVFLRFRGKYTRKFCQVHHIYHPQIILPTK